MPKLTHLFFNSMSFLLCTSISFAAPLWQNNAVYQADDVVTFEGRDYQALKSHITNPEWIPSRTPTLWRDIGTATAITLANTLVLNEPSNGTKITRAISEEDRASETIIDHSQALTASPTPTAVDAPLQNITRSAPSNATNANNQTIKSSVPVSTPTPAPAPVSAMVITQKCAAPWSSSKVYTAGDVVSLGGNNYQANTQNADKNPKRVGTNIFSAKFWKKRKDWKNWRNQGTCSNTAVSTNPGTTTNPNVPPTPTPTKVVGSTPIPTAGVTITPVPTNPGHTLITPTPTTKPISSTPLPTTAPSSTPLPVPEPIKSALRLATERAISYQQRQSAAIADIYSGANLNLTLNHGTSTSSEIQRSNSTSAIPFIVADDGSGMAAISEFGKGRALAYGANVLNWMANQSKETQHLPLFTRAFNWVVTGKAAGPLPATLKFATAGYDTATVSKLITLLGKTPQTIICDLADANNSCWQDADLLVFGGGVKDDPALIALVRKYQESGKAIIYMHPSWIDSAGGRKVLQAIGMELGGYPGNWFAPLAGVSVGATRTIADAIKKADQMGALVNALTQMADNNPSLNISTETAMTNAISQMQDEMAWMQKRGIDIFTAPNADLHRLLIQWADLYRPSIQYGTIFRTQEPAKFLRTYASDSWLAFNRTNTTVNTSGQGDYMPAAAQSIQVSTTSETIEVTIAQSSGITAIGRGAIPGKPVYIEIVNTSGTGALELQTSHVRAYGNPLTDNEKEGYKRPREPQSFPIPLASTGENVFVTPFGGPLMLRYSGATAGESVTLKIRGAAKYAHFDFTKPQSDADIAEAVAALNRADFGWQTSKFVGGEIQQTIGYAKQAIGNTDPKVVIIDQVKGSLFDSNHIANGYNNMPMSNNVSLLCTQFGWDCTGPIHRAPSVQHFIGWIAACGFLCSGNPSDGFSGIGGTGWGHAHELGHNTVQRVMHITFNGKGCVVECDNNVLASIQMMRQFKTLGIDTGHSTDHPGLYQRVVANRNSGTVGDAKVLNMQTSLWDMDKGQNPMRAVHFQLAFLFSKYRAQEAIPSMEATLDYFTLLTKGDRLVARAWDANNKDKYAMGSFSNNTISNPDLLFVLSSKIIGKDLRTIFAMYGMSVSQTALDSVASLGLPIVSEEFYALANGKHNQPSTGQWLNLAGQTPNYPF